MRLVICYSHLYVPTVVSLVLDSPADQFLIYSGNKSICDFFHLLKLENVTVYFDDPAKDRLPFLKKRTLKAHFDTLDITEVIFLHYSYCFSATWLIKHLKDRNKRIRISRIPFAKSHYIDHPLPCNVKQRVKKWMLDTKLGMEWGVPYNHARNLYGFEPNYDPRFYDQVDAKVFDYRFDLSQLLDRLDHILLPTIPKEKSILVLENSRLSMNRDGYLKLLDQLCDALKGYKLYFKNHPGSDTLVGKENEMEVIPSFISGNLLVRKFSCIMGVDSALLGEAAHMGTLAISLSKIYQMDQSFIDAQKRNYDIIGGGDVRSPQTIEELQAIVKNV